MTPAGVRERPVVRASAGGVVRLHLVSRGVPAAVTLLVGFAVFLRVASHFGWIQGGGVLAQQIPLLVEGGAAMVVVATARSPFGELEHSTAHRLPWLRLGTVLALTSLAVGALAATAARLPGGVLEMARGVAGVTGVGLLSAAVLGGAAAWVGPVVYLVVAEYALTAKWTTPWIWSARPSHDHGATLCAALVFAAGAGVVGWRGARLSTHE